MTLANVFRWVFWSPLVRGPLVIAAFFAGYVLSLRLPIISEQANPTLVSTISSVISLSPRSTPRRYGPLTPSSLASLFRPPTSLSSLRNSVVSVHKATKETIENRKQFWL